jgi:hypothetical protein
MNSLRFSGWLWFETCSAENHGPLDHEDVEAGADDRLGVPLDTLGGERGARDDPGLLDLADPPLHELVLERLAVQLLHARGRLLVGQGADLLVDGLRILVAGPQALEVQTREAAELPDSDRGCRRHAGVHRRRHHRQPERVGVDLPGDVDVVGISRSPGRDDRHLVEPVRAPGHLPLADLDLHARPSWSLSPRSERPGYAAAPTRSGVDAVTPCGEGTTAVRSDRVAPNGSRGRDSKQMTTFT